VLICTAVAIFVFFTAHLVASRWKWLLWLDAVGLAAFAAMGAAKGLAITGQPVVAIITGMLTATFGGILRDIVAGEPSVLLRPEVYISAAGRRRRRLCACRQPARGPGHLSHHSLRRCAGGARRRALVRLDLCTLQEPAGAQAGGYSVGQ
jgi:hypothetical protein